MSCNLTVHTGRNVWVLARTDADGAPLDDVLQTAANTVKHFLDPITPISQRSIFEHLLGVSPRDPAAQALFIIGSARPVEIAAVQMREGDDPVPRVRVPAGCLEHKLREQCDVLYTLEASRPWLIMIAFDWRAATAVIPWPHRRVDVLGFTHDSETENQWVLLESCWLGDAQSEDTDLASEVARNFSEATKAGLEAALRAAEQAAEKAKKAAVMIAQLAVVGLGGFLLYRAVRNSTAHKGRKRAKLSSGAGS